MKLNYQIQIICTVYPDGVTAKYVNINAGEDSIDLLIEKHIRPQLAVLRDTVIAESKGD